MSEQIAVVKITLVESKVSVFPQSESKQLDKLAAAFSNNQKLRLGQTVVYAAKSTQDWLEELSLFISEGDALTQILVTLDDMPKDEFDNLPEFTGF